MEFVLSVLVSAYPNCQQRSLRKLIIIDIHVFLWKMEVLPALRDLTVAMAMPLVHGWNMYFKTFRYVLILVNQE